MPVEVDTMMSFVDSRKFHSLVVSRAFYSYTKLLDHVSTSLTFGMQWKNTQKLTSHVDILNKQKKSSGRFYYEEKTISNKFFAIKKLDCVINQIVLSSDYMKLNKNRSGRELLFLPSLASNGCLFVGHI